MTPEEILQALYDETLVGNAPAVLELTRQGLDNGMTPESMLFDALIPSLEEVGARFERGDFFVPEMLIAGRAMSGALEILRPLLAETGAETVGTFVMGTVKGDVHDIGKNLVNIMLEGAGFHVIDLGRAGSAGEVRRGDQRAQARDRRLLGVPHHHDADVQGQHQRAREGRDPRPGARHGRRCTGHPGVRRRGGRRRVRRRRLADREEGAASSSSSSAPASPPEPLRLDVRPTSCKDTHAHSVELRQQRDRDRSRPAVLPDRRTDQPDRTTDLPGAAARR